MGHVLVDHVLEKHQPRPINTYVAEQTCVMAESCPYKPHSAESYGSNDPPELELATIR